MVFHVTPCLQSTLAFLLLTFPLVAPASQRFEASGEWPLANVTREQAIKLAREQAMAEILHQSGVDVSAQTVVVNQRMASYQLLATRNARVVNLRCTDSELERVEGTSGGKGLYLQKTRCSGEVQRFGNAAPNIEATLTLSRNGGCMPSADADGRSDESVFTARANESFCLKLRAAAETWVGVYGLFEQNGETRVVRVFPQPGGKQSALHLTENVVPELPPLASTPLPGEAETTEAMVIVASHQPALLDRLAGENSVGDNVTETVNASVPISVFDKHLGQLDLRHVNLRFLPYRVIVQ